MKLYYLQVKEKYQELYFPEHLWKGTCFIWAIDEEHVYVKFIRENKVGIDFIVGPVDRYVKTDILMTLIEDYPDIEYYEGETP